MATLRRIDGTIIDSCDSLSIKDLVIRNKDNLKYADLSSAYLPHVNLSSVDLTEANLSSADLSGADLSHANLSHANLSYTRLSYANLLNARLLYANFSSARFLNANFSNADLFGAKFLDADLCNANFSNANLSCAIFTNVDFSHANLINADFSSTLFTNVKYNKFIVQPLNELLLTKGKKYAYKLVTSDFRGPWFPKITFEIGREYFEDNYDVDEKNLCGAGLNVATLQWCLKNYRSSLILLRVEHETEDIVAIPLASDGKYRVKRFKVLEEVILSTVGL